MTDRMTDTDRNARRIAAQAQHAETGLLALAVAAIALALILFNVFMLPKADAAKRAVYKGTVTICYAPTAKAPKMDQYLFNQWDVAAAAKAAGPSIGSVRVVKERYPHTTCYGEVSIWSSPDAYANNATRPYSVYKYGETGVMWESQITMGDKVGAKSTAAQRQAWLVAALKTAIPR